jgi:hypothetical protein
MGARKSEVRSPAQKAIVRPAESSGGAPMGDARLTLQQMYKAAQNPTSWFLSAERLARVRLRLRITGL